MTVMELLDILNPSETYRMGAAVPFEGDQQRYFEVSDIFRMNSEGLSHLVLLFASMHL